jgi:hypothetical protein
MNNEAPHCAVFSILPPLFPLRSKYSPQHPVLRLSIYILPLVWETNFHIYTKQQVK